MKNENFYDKAIIHSRKDMEDPTDTVLIVEYRDNNNVVAEYNGRRYTAIFNPYVGMFYVDDIYGAIEGDEWQSTK